ncbi:YARHG domain-containing protein [Akkermansiaceae bacterium]|nr:YARHG domain-containing protein [Akkermansiaceae bacterium]
MKNIAALCVGFSMFAFVSAQDDADVSSPDKAAAAMKGTYVGDFGGKKITVCLDRIVGKTVTGYSIVAGNERAFSGSFKASEKGFEIVAEEPGDRPDDGLFKMIYSPESDDLGGIWKPNDPKKITERVFVLPRRIYKYDPKVGDYPQSSTKKLAEKDVENMRPAELRIMRNEIYARHGYTFQLADMRQHFDRQGWYMAVNKDVTDKLTATEKKNAELIKRYEKYGEEYYDSFGR